MRRRKVRTERRRWAERAARQRFHDLRQTCATLLLTKGVHPKIVSEMLGHSSVSITLDVYSHVIPVLGEGAPSPREEALGNYYPSQPNLNAYQASITVEG
jgi:integrase